MVPLSAITVDMSLQPRADGLREDTVQDYADAIDRGDVFPPLVVYEDAETGVTWLSEGFHRHEAYIRADKSETLCEVRAGNRPDALRNACGSNLTHGLRRTNADKCRAVDLLVAAFPDLSDQQIAEMAGVGRTFVHGRRPQPPSGAKRKGADGRMRPARSRHSNGGQPVAATGSQPNERQSDAPLCPLPNERAGENSPTLPPTLATGVKDAPDTSGDDEPDAEAPLPTVYRNVEDAAGKLERAIKAAGRDDSFEARRLCEQLRGLGVIEFADTPVIGMGVNRVSTVRESVRLGEWYDRIKQALADWQAGEGSPP
jgi:hypothetical protein